MSEFYVPKGWKLVPEEPTEDMVAVGNYEAMKGGSDLWQLTREVMNAYRAMLAAAPAAQEVQPLGPGSRVRCVANLRAGQLEFHEGREYVVKRRQGGDVEIYNDMAGSFASVEVSKLSKNFEVILYAAPPAHPDAALVEAADAALKAIQDTLEDAYHNAFPECCGQAYLECCGSPVQAWDERDQKIMDRLGPHEKALRAALAGKGGTA